MGLPYCACPTCDCPETLYGAWGQSAEGKMCGYCSEKRCDERAQMDVQNVLENIRSIVRNEGGFIGSDAVAAQLQERYISVLLPDAYGSAHIRDNGVVMLNTYGDEDDYPDGVCYCAALLSATWQLCFYDLDAKGNIVQQLIKPYPEELKVPICYSKRAYFWYRDTGLISLRVKPEDWDKIPEHYRHKQPQGTVSAPRMLF